MRALPRAGVIEISGVRARAITAAIQILVEEGQDGLNLRAIAQRAGVGLASIYHYFASKDELLLHLAMAGYDELRRRILAQQGRPDEVSPMRAGAHAFYGFAAAEPALFTLMFDSRLLAGHASLRAAEQSLLDLYAASVEADEQFPAGQRRDAALALWTMGRGVAAMMASEPTGRLPAEVLERFFAGARYVVRRTS